MEDNAKMDLKTCVCIHAHTCVGGGVFVHTGLTWLKTGTGGGHLPTQ
jgi:hypothetical protein